MQLATFKQESFRESGQRWTEELVTLVRTFDTDASSLGPHADLHLLRLMAKHFMSLDHWASFPFRHCYPMLLLSLFPFSAVMRHLLCFTLLSERRPSKAMNQSAARKKNSAPPLLFRRWFCFTGFIFAMLCHGRNFLRPPDPNDPDSRSGCGAKLWPLWFWAGEVKRCTWQGPASWFQVGSPRMVLQYESRRIAPY